MNAYGLEKINTFDQLLLWLQDNLNWPIDEMEVEEEPFENLTFEYDPANDLGLKAKDVAHFRQICQLRPFVSSQPWGIFFISFEDKKIPVGVLKRVLGGLTLKKRQSANKSHQKGWNLHDLLFISAHGESGERELSFLHFAEENKGKNKIILKELGWDQNDTNLKLAYVANTLRDRLVWPEDEKDTVSWRKNWAGAFTSKHGAAISTTKDLTKRLGVLATKIRISVNEVLAAESADGPVTGIYGNFKQTLFHNLDHDGFADMYAQTICYGLLVARIMRRSGGLVADDAALIAPLTQPFLKDLMETFLALGGRKNKIDFNELGIDEVVDALYHSDMEAVLRDFGNKNPHEDPILHFYEYFLKEYDSILREQRGVYYTPLPVVRFIVRSVDEILQKEFGLTDGLADTTTWGEMIKRNPDITLPNVAKASDPFIQILDPAIGTGTFLVEVIDLIEKRMKGNWEEAGKTKKEIDVLWNEYVPTNLIPRLNGFELMMAPYAIAHIKIGMKLAETGYQPKNNTAPRVRVYLANTLEEPTGLGQQTIMHFITEILAKEAHGADNIKANTPITVVIGNPPYSKHNENRNPTVKNRKATFIGELIDNYYYIDEQPLNERNSKNIKADENKFICYAESRINMSGVGILGYISSNGYLDGTTMRAMRWHLLKTFNRIQVLDLHGSVKRDRTSPDGSKDENVFSIQQGVAIALMRLNSKPSIFFHQDIWGKRENKYKWLLSNTSNNHQKNTIEPCHDKYFFVPRDQKGIEEYGRDFISIADILMQSKTGFITHRDHFAMAFEESEIRKRIEDLRDSSLSDDVIRERYKLKDTRDWKLQYARKTIQNDKYWLSKIKSCLYKPFDSVYCYHSNVAMDWPREEIMYHMLAGENVGLIATCQQSQNNEAWALIGVTSEIIECCAISNRTREKNYLFPLYQMPHDTETEIRPNLSNSFAHGVATHTELIYKNDVTSNLNMGRGDLKKTFGPRDVFDYIYAVMHSPSYRTRYADLLKSDYPRIPLPGSADVFRELVTLGRNLVALHLLDRVEAKSLNQPETRFIKKNEAQVKKGFPKYDNGKIMINSTCHFEDVTFDVWNFHIGSYQVCEKWLKDRAGKGGKTPHPGQVLTETDTLHYRRITIAIRDTIALMAQIDEVIEEHGGWPDAFVAEAGKE